MWRSWAAPVDVKVLTATVVLGLVLCAVLPALGAALVVLGPFVWLFWRVGRGMRRFM